MMTNLPDYEIVRISYIRYLTHGNNKGETKRRNKYKNKTKIIKEKFETKDEGLKGKNVKQGLNTNAQIAYTLYYKYSEQLI